MTEGRYHELLGRMLDSRLSEAEAEELRVGLEADPARLRDLREHLMLWELWAQEQSTARGPDAFRQRFEDRLRAEIERPAADVPPAAAADRPRPRHGLWLRLAWAAGLLLALTAALIRFGTPAGTKATDHPTASARLVSLRGEAVCTRCILHQTRTCQLALRVQRRGHEETWAVNPQGAESDLGHAYCLRPLPILAQGTLRSDQGRPLLLATKLEVQR